MRVEFNATFHLKATSSHMNTLMTSKGSWSKINVYISKSPDVAVHTRHPVAWKIPHALLFSTRSHHSVVNSRQHQGKLKKNT